MIASPSLSICERIAAAAETPRLHSNHDLHSLFCQRDKCGLKIFVESGAPKPAGRGTITARPQGTVCGSFCTRFPSVVVRWIAIHGVNVKGRVAPQGLGRVLNYQMRTLDPVISVDIGSRGRCCRTAPREPGVSLMSALSSAIQGGLPRFHE